MIIISSFRNSTYNLSVIRRFRQICCWFSMERKFNTSLNCLIIHFNKYVVANRKSQRNFCVIFSRVQGHLMSSIRKNGEQLRKILKPYKLRDTSFFFNSLFSLFCEDIKPKRTLGLKVKNPFILKDLPAFFSRSQNVLFSLLYWVSRKYPLKEI